MIAFWKTRRGGHSSFTTGCPTKMEERIKMNFRNRLATEIYPSQNERSELIGCVWKLDGWWTWSFDAYHSGDIN